MTKIPPPATYKFYSSTKLEKSEMWQKYSTFGKVKDPLKTFWLRVENYSPVYNPCWW